MIGLENYFLVFLKVSVLHRFYCIQSGWHLGERERKTETERERERERDILDDVKQHKFHILHGL